MSALVDVLHTAVVLHGHETRVFLPPQAWRSCTTRELEERNPENESFGSRLAFTLATDDGLGLQSTGGIRRALG